MLNKVQRHSLFRVPILLSMLHGFCTLKTDTLNSEKTPFLSITVWTVAADQYLQLIFSKLEHQHNQY